MVLPNRLLTYLNYAVAVLVAMALFAVFWLVYLPLPRTSGNVSAPIAAEGTIVRDSIGVAHIHANSMEDALFLQGYATAQDRLWQMETLRRFGAGELSEIIGKATLETDRQMRNLRLSRLADEGATGLSAMERAGFAAYIRGVNHFIDTHRSHLPVEFTILRCDPKPWRISDGMITGLILFQNLTNSSPDELRKSEMLAAGDPAKISYLWPLRAQQDFQPGSNAWVLAGSRTTSGKPILANDPHLEHALPSRWYMVDLEAPGFHVSGVSLPGLPGVIIGHNDRIAWGITNLHFDVQDFYREQLDPRTGRYRFQNTTEQARPERDLIKVKNDKPVQIDRWVTRHGPVVNSENGQYLALKWTASEQGGFRFPFLEIDKAANWDQFRATLSTFPGPGSNFVYADVDGHIGYQVAGKLPVRKGYHGDIPADGSSGQSEWQGYIPFEELPRSFDPPSGMIVTANQNPFPPAYPYDVNGAFAPGYRAGQIKALLLSKPKWSPAEMIAIQKDVYSPYLHFLAGQIVKAYEGRKVRDDRWDEAVSELRRWNGQMEKGQAAPMIVSLLAQYVSKTVANRAAPGKSDLYRTAMSSSVVERLLRERPTGWFDDYNQMLIECFADALDEGTRLQGKHPAKWDWGHYGELTLPNLIVGRVPVVGKYFNIGPYPMSGSSTSVKQTTTRLMPSMRFVADLSDWDNSLMNITVGQSGQPLSSHYKDQWEHFYTGQSFPMRFKNIGSGSVLRVHPE